ncbi:MAG TPA: MFS transporter [Rhizomicrobium sp.]|jgi:MFS family permease
MPPAIDSIGAYPPRSQGWWAVCIFAIAAVLSYTDRQILGLLVDPIGGDLHISDTQLSILQGAAFAVLYSFIGLPLGRVADLVPRRALLVFAVAMWSFGTILCGLSHSFAELFGARLLVGIGEAALAPAAMSLIGDYFPPAVRALPTGVFLTGMVIGGGAAIAIGGFLLAAAQHAMFAHAPLIGALPPWRTVLVILGIFGLVMAPLFLTIREPGMRKFSLREIQMRLLSLADMFRAFRGHYAMLLPLYGAMTIGSIVDYAILSWTPALLARHFALTPGEIGAGLGGAAIAAGLIGTPLGGALADWVSKRYGPLSRIRLCGFILLAGFVAAPVGIMATPSFTLASVFAWILISSVSGTIGIATTLDLLPHESRGLGTATIAFCNTIVGLGLGPTLVALTTDHIYGAPSAVGLALSTVVTPAVAICCLLFYIAARAVRRSQVVIA